MAERERDRERELEREQERDLERDREQELELDRERDLERERMTTEDKLDRLRKRAAHLTVRIEAAAAQGKTLSFDAAERGALLWAIDMLTKLSRKEQP